MRQSILAATSCIFFFNAAAWGQNTASAVVSYTPGDFTNSPQFANYTNAYAATGPLQGDTTYGGLNPFNPPFSTAQIVGIGAGGQLTLQMAAPVSTTGATLGVFSNSGLNDVSADGTGTASDPAQTLDEAYFQTDPEAAVSVSQDGVKWYALNSGNPLLFTNPSNYYLDESINEYYEPLGSVIANQYQPFLGTLSSFNGLDFQQILALLNGSAGGTWLDLSGLPISSVNFVQFSVPDDADYGMAVDSVSAVPEPALALPLVIGLASILRRRRRNTRET